MESTNEQKLYNALQELVNTARPSFPNTPYRDALESAKKLLKEVVTKSL